MELELVHRWSSNLTEEDDHPYRSGAWRPQLNEWNATELEAEGAIPDDLDGIYLRNTENPLLDALQLYHPFDGDGMIHMVAFRNGKAHYRNRFIQTDGLRAELAAGHALWAGIAEPKSLTKVDYGWGARGLLKDSSSTDVVVHAGEVITSFYQCGDLYRLSATTLETLGKADFQGKFPWEEGVSAHPKIDEHTGEMMFFNYSNREPYMHYGVVDKDNNLVTYCDIPLPGPRLSHDMAITEHYSVLNDCPLFADPEAIKAGKHRVRFFPELPTRIGVIPRHGRTEDLRWFEFSSTYVLHWVNAFEDGDWVVLDGFFQENPSPKVKRTGSIYDVVKRMLDGDEKKPRLHRWRMNMKTGATEEYDLTDFLSEFGMVNGLHTGRKHNLVYSATRVPGMFLFNGVAKHDIARGTVEHVALPPGVFGSEASMAPRVGSTAEDDGYVITITSDTNNDTSECLIFDAANFGNGPVCRVKLPERVAAGTHSFWAAGHTINGWDDGDDPHGPFGR